MLDRLTSSQTVWHDACNITSLKVGVHTTTWSVCTCWPVAVATGASVCSCTAVTVPWACGQSHITPCSAFSCFILPNIIQSNPVIQTVHFRYSRSIVLIRFKTQKWSSNFLKGGKRLPIFGFGLLIFRLYGGSLLLLKNKHFYYSFGSPI